MRLHLVTALLVALATTACGADDPEGSTSTDSAPSGETASETVTESSTPSPTPDGTESQQPTKLAKADVYDTVGNRCVGDPWAKEEPEHVVFRTRDKVELFGVEVGQGPRGVVLLHGTDRAALCNWMTGATWLAEDGYHVLALDHRCAGFSGCQESTTDLDVDVTAAVRQLRKMGATSVTVIGESRGGGVALAGASRPEADMDAVVALSGVWQAITHSDDVAATAPEAVPDIRVPVLYGSSTGDGQIDQAEYRALAKATAQQQYVAVKPYQHGHEMFGADRRSRFYRDDLLPFLAANGS